MTIALIAAAAVVLGAAVAMYYYYWAAPVAVFDRPRVVSVKKGETLRTVAGKLKAAGVVRSALVLSLYARLTGRAQRIQPGDYAFKGGERVAQVMQHLVDGDYMVVIVTIPEGLTVHQVALRLQQAGLVCEQDFERAAQQGRLVRALGLGPLGAEGYLFPATYRFSPLARPDDILAAMLKRFFAVLTPAVERRRFELGLTTRELVTLASIIEKEAKMAGERPLIAGVFYNRLRLKMPLQSDPTAQYSFEGTSYPAALAVHTLSAFNTYDFVGLPPGPIANPGWPSLSAALYPARTDFLYFVARSDGSHVFSRSLSEHERAIASLRNPAQLKSSAASAGTASVRGTGQEANRP